MVSRNIALVFDCDDTLAPDTTTWFLGKIGIDASGFSQEAAALVRKGWDPPLAYLDLLRRKTGGGDSRLTSAKLADLGRDVPFYPGVPEIFDALRAFMAERPRFRQYGINLQFFVISGGIQDLLEHTCISPYLNDLWACRLHFDEDGGIIGPCSIVTFTEKTRYLFCINKGIVGTAQRENPYLVNASIAREARAIPFPNMIYLGDGPSDVPCMSIIEQYGGYVLGIAHPDNVRRAYELSLGRRANMTAPADFSETSIARRALKEHIERIANRICDDIDRTLVRAPQY